jgi:hypothetical protein
MLKVGREHASILIYRVGLAKQEKLLYMNINNSTWRALAARRYCCSQS